MRPRELLDAIAEETGYPKVQIRAVLQAEAKLIAEALARQEEVLSPLGRFKPVERPERQGRNPRTGEPMTIAARTVIRFAPRGGRANAPGSDDEI